VGWLRVAVACAIKAVRSSLTERSVLVQSVTLPVNYLIMMSLFALAGSHAPTAVVMLDHGHYAQQFVAAMREAGSFRITMLSQAQAAARMRQGTLVSTVTIPASFGRAVAHGQAVHVQCQINGIDEDLTADTQRGMRLALTTFYAHAMPGTIPVTASEHNEYSAPAGYILFLALSITVIAFMVSGLLQAGNAAARDWERGTVKEILLAPAPRSAVLAGQMAGAYIAALPAAVIVLGVVTAVNGAWPANPGLVIGAALLTLAVFVAAGTALGTAVKDRSVLAILVRGVPVPLFFLSGVFGALTFQTPAVQAIGASQPVHYAIVLEQMAFRGYGTGTLPLGADAAVLGGYLAVFAVLAAAALRFSGRAIRKAG
jgi:ABC-type multidrug transport system permease subunit